MKPTFAFPVGAGTGEPPPGPGAEVNLREMSDAWSTKDLPDDVVNQRLIVTSQVSSYGDRTGKFGMAFWLDRGGPDDAWFTIGPEGYRGVLQNGRIVGPGLSADERRWIAAHLYSLAVLVRDYAE